VTSPSAILTEGDAADVIVRGLQPTEPGRGSVGLEVEWIVVDPSDPARPVTGDEVLAATAGPMPAGGRLGVEPGGQLELDTERHIDAASALAAVSADEDVLHRRLERAGLRLLSTGFDPFRPPLRSLDLPRYRAMEAALDARGPQGRMMMCSTAALQVNIDFGRVPAETWERASLVAPVLAAAFANSPGRSADGTAVASVRSTIWAAIDPTRTRAVPVKPDGAWVDYALDANLLFIRDGDDAHPMADPFTLREWINSGHHLGFPDAGDVAEHLTTLFPPVRPRGWLECRFFDALGPEERSVAVLAIVALAGDGPSVDEVRTACGGIEDPWSLVPYGTSDPAMRRAAGRCMQLAADVLDADRPGSSAPIRVWAAGRDATGWKSDVTVPDLQSLARTLGRTEQEIP